MTKPSDNNTHDTPQDDAAISQSKEAAAEAVVDQPLSSQANEELQPDSERHDSEKYGSKERDIKACTDAQNAMDEDKDDEPAPINWFSGMIVLFGLAAFLIVGFCLGAFFRFAEDITQTETLPSQIETDAIVVLTGGQQRITAAVELLAQNDGKKLFISGVNPAIGEAELRRVSGASTALFDCCIEFGISAENTVGNGQEIASWAMDNQFKSLTVVTSDYHMPRSLFELRQVSDDLAFVPYPVNIVDFQDYVWAKDPETLRILVREFIKLNMAYLR